MRLHRSLLAASALAGLMVAGTAQAGEQYVDTTGFAVSGYDVVSYHGLEQSAVGQPQPAPLAGKASITAEYNGATWAFATEENRDLFLADPERYAPEYDGHCAYGVALEGKVPGNPLLWRIVDGELYLNVTETVVGFWEEDIPGYIDQAETHWPGLEADPANTGAIPEFDPAAAPLEG